ncbi:hypothetical protein [Thiorhodospira sibirica]|uniref:hypothetical protein n=1 Tax=Thiorhodospira sibirica TaxID=154347 RepID=UPI00022C5E67|nr:hypothetical protein [Thiorhodospira sibirica]
MVIKKRIKFDFVMDGHTISDIDSLREHFCTEVYEHLHSGLLEKWLLSRKENALAEQV